MIIRTTFLILMLVTALPARSQGASDPQVRQIDKRVGTLESQMRAVQRQIFPGGDKRFFAPEVTAPPAEASPPAGSAASAPLVDLSQRVNVLEMQQRTLTGQVEQLQFQLRQMETAMQKLRGDAEFRLDALEGKGASAAPPTEARAAVRSSPAPTPVDRAPAVPSPVAPAPAAPAAAEGDSVEAAYLAGYRMYQRGEHAAAAKALSAFVAANPKHPRASNAQFWAGRAIMAQGQNAEAAKAFLAGYQQFPRGERAHNSLLWLGKALTAMNQLKAACQALDQLRTAYPDRLTGAVANEAAAARAAAKCGA